MSLKKNIKEIAIIISLLVGVLLHDGSELIGWLGTIGLLSGFINVYLTTKRSEWFIIPDLIWIVASVMSLYLTENFSDMLLYIFYIFIGIKQFFEWKTNKDDSGKTIVKYTNRIKAFLIATTLTVSLIIMFQALGIQTSNLVLGSMVTGFGIVGSIYLAYRFYEAELLFLVSNIANVIVLGLSGLYQLMLIPLCFAFFAIIFLVENRKKS